MQIAVSDRSFFEKSINFAGLGLDGTSLEIINVETFVLGQEKNQKESIQVRKTSISTNTKIEDILHN